jgi:hypothetical protein
MLKRLALKLITLSALVAALTAVSSAPASAKNYYCFDAPMESGCPTYICCRDNDCWCVG